MSTNEVIICRRSFILSKLRETLTISKMLRFLREVVEIRSQLIYYLLYVTLIFQGQKVRLK